METSMRNFAGAEVATFFFLLKKFGYSYDAGLDVGMQENVMGVLAAGTSAQSHLALPATIGNKLES